MACPLLMLKTFVLGAPVARKDEVCTYSHEWPFVPNPRALQSPQ